MKVLKPLGIILGVTWISFVTHASLYGYIRMSGGKAILISVIIASVFISGLTLLAIKVSSKGEKGEK